jgi:hypothetical protein
VSFFIYELSILAFIGHKSDCAGLWTSVENGTVILSEAKDLIRRMDEIHRFAQDDRELKTGKETSEKGTPL